MGISHDLKHLFFCILEQRNNFLSLLKMDHSAPEQRLSLVGRTSSPFSALKYYSTPFKNTAKGLFWVLQPNFTTSSSARSFPSSSWVAFCWGGSHFELQMLRPNSVRTHTKSGQQIFSSASL